ncbi:hypothetical protein KZ829_21560 [Actinoplanes hulinensis]|uniref:Uncharacterized protein n=1 Tax=Actinoplanes hulinensis TaxID=1144547 RepID=A0ABS7B5K7_9ACTN|nr:hypothetical protein [Actinoplanes hulinensis]MBW6436330.1 hypothetical protein [Actinoplanes hulinensis]
MTYPDRDGAWRPRPAQRPEEETTQPFQALPPPPSIFAPPPVAVPRPEAPVAPVAAEPVAPAPRETETADPVARRLAAPAVTSAPLAAPSALAAVGVPSVTDRPDSGGPPPEGGAEAAADARVRPSGRMHRLHAGRHTISRATLKRITVAPSTGAGLIIGRDRQHAAVPLRLFTPEPVRVTLVGGVWAAQLVVFRAFSMGARVTVVTDEPHAWAGFGERATGQHNRLRVLNGPPGPAGPGTPQAPMLTVYDLGMTGPAATTPLGPWRSQLTVLRQLDRSGVPALQDAQVVLLQRLGGDEAALVSSALRLRPHSSQFLQFMADDMMALIDEGTDRYLFLAQTEAEHREVGAPRR